MFTTEVWLTPLILLPGVALLPPRVRDGYDIAWSTQRQMLATALGMGLRTWVRLMPRGWRAMPPARDAERRVAAVFGD